MIDCYFHNGAKVALRHIAINALVVDQENILLIQRSHRDFMEAGKLALPGGYLDKNETVQEGVRREVIEETGYQTKIKKLFLVNDNTHRSGDNNYQNVVLCFLASMIQKKQEPDSEVAAVKWLPLNTLPPRGQFAFDHYSIIDLYRQHREQSHSLPIFWSEQLLSERS